METLDAIFSRRSTRQFSDKGIEPDLLHQVLRAGAVAPSGGNLQARSFVVVQAHARVEALRSLAPGIIGKPAAVIAICLDRPRAGLQGSGSGGVVWIDIGVALQNMLLAAHSLGLGACPIGSFHARAVALFLELPEEVQPVLLLALGHPEKPPPASTRRPLTEIVFAEGWGTPYAE